MNTHNNGLIGMSLVSFSVKFGQIHHCLYQYYQLQWNYSNHFLKYNAKNTTCGDPKKKIQIETR